MDLLQTINSELEACLNAAISSTKDDQISFSRQEFRDRITSILESAKLLELKFVEENHKLKFPSQQTELEALRAEVAMLRASKQLKSETLDSVKQQVQDWTKTMEPLFAKQLQTMFELVPPAECRKASNNQQIVSTVTTDEIWWGQHATDESEDL